MNRWIMALPILAVGISISGGGAAGAALLVDAVADALSPAQGPVRALAQRQNSAVHRVHHRPRLVRAKPPAPDPGTAFAKARLPELASTRTVTASEDEDVMRPHSVPTVSVPAYPAGADTPEAIMAPQAIMAPRADEEAKKPPMWPALERSSAPSMPIDLMMLLSTCAGAAMGVYGLVAFNSRRRAARVSRPSGRGTKLPRPADRYADRAARQRLFPHQLGIPF